MNVSQILTNVGLAIGVVLTAVMMVSAFSTVLAPFIPARNRSVHPSERGRVAGSFPGTTASEKATRQNTSMSVARRSDPSDEQRAVARLMLAKAQHPTSRAKAVATVTPLFPSGNAAVVHPSEPVIPPTQQVA